MEEAYEQYLNKKEGTTKQRKRMKKKHAEDGELLEVWLFTFSSYSFEIFLCCLFMSLFVEVVKRADWVGLKMSQNWNGLG